MEDNNELTTMLNDFQPTRVANEPPQHNNDIKSFVATFNNSIVKESLMPELIENEQQKRTLKENVLNRVCLLILVHSVLMLICLGILIGTVTLGSNIFPNINENLCLQLIDFMKFFVIASLCEFVAMLFVIVRYVFDKSIAELVALFKDDEIKTLNDKKEKITSQSRSCNDNLSEDNSQRTA